jgi:hypothetical protein
LFKYTSSLATFSLRLSTLFGVGLLTRLHLSFSQLNVICVFQWGIYISTCLMKIMKLCKNVDVINKKNACSMWTHHSWGDNSCLYIDFGNLMSSSCQWKDPCPVLHKLELLISLSTFISNQFPFVNRNNSNSCILCDDYWPPNGLGIQDATC